MMSLVVVMLVASTAVAMPRSASFAVPSSPISTFDGFTSRWITPAGVGVIQRGADLAQDGDGALRRQRSAKQPLLQRLALHVLHDDQQGVVVGRRVEDRDHVGVVQRCAQASLAAEAGQGVLRAGGRQALERHQATEALVFGQQNAGPHTARAESLEHAVPAAKNQRRVCTWWMHAPKASTEGRSPNPKRHPRRAQNQVP